MLGLRARLKDPGFWIDVLIVFLLGSVGLVFRSMLWDNRMRLPAGDTFNFINAAGELARGTYPPGEKRPPFFSALIVIVNQFITDPIESAAFIIIISGVVGIILMYFIGRHFAVYRPVMAGFAALALFDPLLSLYGIRPLSQGLFFALLTLVVLLAIKAREVRWYPPLMAGSLVALALTRQEGVIIAAAVWLLLFWKLPWKKVISVGLFGFLFLIPWLIIVTNSTGSPFKFPGSEAYVEEFTSGERGTTDIRVVLSGIAEISNETWAIAWNSSVLVPEEGDEGEKSTPDAIAALAVGLLAVIGLGWMIIRQPRDMAIFFAAFVLIVVIAAWYRASGKYASPFISTWYICAAAGLTALSEMIRRLFPRLEFPGRVAAYVATLVIVWPLAPAMAVSGTSYIVAEMGMNWSRLQAIRYVDQLHSVILVPGTTLLGRSYLGTAGNPTEPPHLGVFLANVAEESVEVQRAYAIEYNVEFIVDDASEETQKLIQYLSSLEEVTLVKLFVSYLEGDEIGQIIRVYRFSPKKPS